MKAFYWELWMLTGSAILRKTATQFQSLEKRCTFMWTGWQIHTISFVPVLQFKFLLRWSVHVIKFTLSVLFFKQTCKVNCFILIIKHNCIYFAIPIAIGKNGHFYSSDKSVASKLSREESCCFYHRTEFKVPPHIAKCGRIVCRDKI